MSVEVDKAVLALLRAEFTGYTSERVHDGEVKGADWDEKAISAPTPFVVFFGSSGIPASQRLAGYVSRNNDIRVTATGSTREQAAFAADKVERALHGKRVLGKSVQLSPGDGRSTPRRDDVWTKPDNGPLYIVTLSFDRR
jgi:hypothetical protein